MGVAKNSKQMERHFKGIANHWRIDIIQIVRNNPGITVDGIADMSNGNFKTISEHTRRLVQAGLINKEYSGRSVVHSLSPYGKTFAKFIESFQHS
jgi:predicted transcriptional regulator